MVVDICVDRTVRLWDIETSKLLYSFNEHENQVLCVDISPLQSNNNNGNKNNNIGGNGYTICSGSFDKTIQCIRRYKVFVYGIFDLINKFKYSTDTQIIYGLLILKKSNNKCGINLYHGSYKGFIYDLKVFILNKKKSENYLKTWDCCKGDLDEAAIILYFIVANQQNCSNITFLKLNKTIILKHGNNLKICLDTLAKLKASTYDISKLRFYGSHKKKKIIMFSECLWL
ncbi:hypothetical protein RFI_04223 [Reticulomyxa filosa]|uniref:Uncharacterized protein n=1 Tax=Reticulomyxa filosa TaxID=46433 RepID=X6P458_RETFI|nr:hypothetical protein RFI_04223 [Reticulomyxa filosa]|eukprot:ETO32893.1 hypothetical protein RFI_04223 [Reticulomyxa filosa]